MKTYKGNMREYLLGFCTTDNDILDNPNNFRHWKCYADDYSHAVEQLKDAEPDTNYHELIEVK